MTMSNRTQIKMTTQRINYDKTLLLLLIEAKTSQRFKTINNVGFNVQQIAARLDSNNIISMKQSWEVSKP